MKNWKECLIDRNLKVKDAIKMLDKFQCIFVVNEYVSDTNLLPKI